MVFQSGCDRCCTAPACTGWFPNSLASSSSSPKPSGNGQPIPAATARSRYSWTVRSTIPQLRAIWRCPNPNSNLNRRTSFVFRVLVQRRRTSCGPFVENELSFLERSLHAPASTCTQPAPGSSHLIDRLAPLRFSLTVYETVSTTSDEPKGLGAGGGLGLIAVCGRGIEGP